MLVIVKRLGWGLGTGIRDWDWGLGKWEGLCLLLVFTVLLPLLRLWPFFVFGLRARAQEASKQAGRQASKQAGTQARKQAGRQAGRQASRKKKQASN